MSADINDTTSQNGTTDMRIIQRKSASTIRKGDILLCHSPTPKKECRIITERRLRRGAKATENDVWKRVQDVKIKAASGDNPNQIFFTVVKGAPSTGQDELKTAQEWCYEDDPVYAIALTRTEATFEALSGVITLINDIE